MRTSEAYLETSRTSTMELFFAKIAAFSRQLFSQKCSIVDVRLGSKYTFVHICTLARSQKSLLVYCLMELILPSMEAIETSR